MLTGENGIIKQAQDAKNETIIEDEKEGISLAYMACKQNNMFLKDVTDEELQNQMNSEGRDVTVAIWGEDLVVVYNKTNNKYKISQTGEIEKQKNLTEEEAKKIVDIVSFLDGNIYVLTAGGEVKLANRTSGNIFDELDSDTTEIITTNGVKSKGMNFFVDNKGKVYTWGANDYGQLGNGTTEYSSKPICISDIEGNELNGKNIVAMSEGGYHKVAIDKNGKVYTWGYNYDGQLGNGTTKNSTVPICISDIEENELNGENIIDVYTFNAYNGDTTIVKDSNGKIYAWGNNENGQIGIGSTGSRVTVPRCISEREGNALNGKNIIDITMQTYDGCTTIIARDIDGKIYTWGYNYSGKLGNGTVQDSNQPICISDTEGNALNGKYITDIYVDENTIIAKDVDGKIYTWGENGSGQLGSATIEDSRVPICISDIEGNALNGKYITDIYVDENTIIAKDIDGKIYTWGSNVSGQLGNGTTQYTYDTPQCISDIEGNALQGKKITDIYSGNRAVIAKDEEGRVYTWGSNDFGQLVNGTTEDSNIPICINNIENSELIDKNIQRIFLRRHGDTFYIFIGTEKESYVYRWAPVA